MTSTSTPPIDGKSSDSANTPPELRALVNVATRIDALIDLTIETEAARKDRDSDNVRRTLQAFWRAAILGGVPITILMIGLGYVVYRSERSATRLEALAAEQREARDATTERLDEARAKAKEARDVAAEIPRLDVVAQPAESGKPPKPPIVVLVKPARTATPATSSAPAVTASPAQSVVLPLPIAGATGGP